MDQWLADPDFWPRLIHPLERDRTLALCQAAVADNRDFELEFQATAADGRDVWLLGLFYVVKSSQGRPRFVRGVMVDTTERNRAHAALDASYAREQGIADTLQRSMLLKVPVDAFPGLSVHTIYEPCLSEALVGGDFFDAFALGGDGVALAIGDVAGKGLMAADGIFEARRGTAFLGQEGVLGLMEKAVREGFISEAGQAIIDGARAFAGGVLRDDACILIAHRN